MATAELVESNEQVAAPESGSRLRLHPDNMYFFEKTDLDGAKANRIEKTDGSQAEGFRLYQLLKGQEKNDNGDVTKAGELCGYVYGKNPAEALYRFAEAKNYDVELVEPGQRGAKGGPRVNAEMLAMLTKMWQKNMRAMVVEAVCESKQYAPHFEFTPDELKTINEYVAEDESAA